MNPEPINRTICTKQKVEIGINWLLLLGSILWHGITALAFFVYGWAVYAAGTWDVAYGPFFYFMDGANRLNTGYESVYNLLFNFSQDLTFVFYFLPVVLIFLVLISLLFDIRPKKTPIVLLLLIFVVFLLLAVSPFQYPIH